jgi:hypothetical protein
MRMQAVGLAVALAVGACGPAAETAAPTPAPSSAVAAQSPSASPSPSRTATPSPTPSPEPPSATPIPSPTPAPVASATSSTDVRTTVRYRVERRTTDAATAGFEDAVHAILTDPRGWVRAGFDFVRDPDGPYLVVLGEGAEVDRLCLPYDTYGAYSCQNGPVVALNADRWRGATPGWTGDLAGYRTMLVNHEVGHLLHLHHPQPQCPGEGWPAPVMLQQSSELGACTANPWPLPWEVALAAERREPLAPPAEHDVSDHRPSPPPERHEFGG